jgi:hypothetical protein
MATEEWLRPFRPLAKFLCIKAVLFFSFWQSCAFILLINMGFFEKETAEIKSLKLQNFIICVEILFATIAMSFAFAAGEFKEKIKHHKKMITHLAQVK